MSIFFKKYMKTKLKKHNLSGWKNWKKDRKQKTNLANLATTWLGSFVAASSEASLLLPRATPYYNITNSKKLSVSFPIARNKILIKNTIQQLIYLVIRICPSSIPYFSLVKDRKRKWLSWLHTRYRETIEDQKDIEIDFYSNDSPNSDLESEFYKTLGDALMRLNIRFHLYATCAYRQALLVGRLLCNRVVGIVWYVMRSYSRVVYC